MAKCACVDCDNPPVRMVLGYLSNIQQDMLGYFCKDCIKEECDHTCRAKKIA